MNRSAVRAALLLLALADTSARAQTQPSLAFNRAQHLQRGINVSHWFSQSANDYSAHHTPLRPMMPTSPSSRAWL